MVFGSIVCVSYLSMRTIAVIIPCYLDSKTLARALDSVRAQTSQVNEVVVVNDCSPETAAIEKILENYPEVTYVKNAVNMGLAATRNAGVDASISEVLTFLDADDELHPQKIELQLPFLSENVAVTCQVQRVLWDELRSSSSLFDKAVLKSKFVWHNKFPLRNFLVGAALMIQRKTFRRVGGYDAELRSCEDFDLWFRLISSGCGVCSLNLPLYYYYCNPIGLSRDFKNISRWELIVLEKNIEKNFARTFVFPIWLMKHFYRAKLSGDSELLGITVENSKKYIKPKFMALAFLVFCNFISFLF